MPHNRNRPPNKPEAEDWPYEPDYSLITDMDAGEPPYSRGFFRSFFMPPEERRRRKHLRDAARKSRNQEPSS